MGVAEQLRAYVPMLKWRTVLAAVLGLFIYSLSTLPSLKSIRGGEGATNAIVSEERVVKGAQESDQRHVADRKGFSAAIYARPTFHEEVVSTMACMLHDEGFHVSVYIGSGITLGRISLPFSHKRERESALFYGSCVDRWITITYPLAKTSFIPNLDLLVFSTYPIFSYSFAEDRVATSLLKYTAAKRKAGGKSTSVVLISHRVNETMHEQLGKIESYIPRNRLTLVFLSEHTELTMRDMLANWSIPYARVNADNMAEMTLEKDMDNYQLSHFFPILPFHQIGAWSNGDIMSDTYNKIWGAVGPRVDTKTFQHGQVFSIQGNFGGRHAHRKDIKGTVECLRDLELGSEDQGMSGSMVTGPVHLDLIGHVIGHVETGELRHGKIRFLRDLTSSNYYKAIANTHFLIAAVAEPDYYCCRATSSVPAALITGTPLVARKDFLAYYPCLNSAAIHTLIAKETECESIKAARELTLEQYLWAREEIKNCSAQFYTEGRRLLRAFAERARVSD